MNNRLKDICLVLSLIGFTLAGCSSVEVKTKYDRSVDFSRFQSFAWETPKPPEIVSIPVNIEVRTRMREAINEQMSLKGLTLTEKENADLIVRLRGRIKEREASKQGKAVGTGTSSYLFEPEVGLTDRPGTAPEGSYGGYRRGTLILEMLDPKQNEVIWSGRAKGVLNETASTDSQVDRFVGGLMDKFPPKPRARD